MKAAILLFAVVVMFPSGIGEERAATLEEAALFRMNVRESVGQANMEGP